MTPLPRTAAGLVALILRVLLGALFVYTGTLKAMDPISFLDSIRTFHILPDPYAAWLAMGLPWLEILAGVALVMGILLEGGLALITGMLAVFLWALIYSWQRGLDIDCGCFGKEDADAGYWDKILRDIALLMVAMGLIIYYGVIQKKSRPPAATESVP